MDGTAAGKREARLIREVYERLLSAYGPRGWWPVTSPGEQTPRYTGGPANDRQRFEVAAGALLTQNTAWRNARLAIEQLTAADLLEPGGIARTGEKRLASLVRSSGFFNQKARRLRALARYLGEVDRPTREGLLALKGIGPETADSIMLYAHGELLFVVDAYTRRVFGRLGVLDGGESYDRVASLFAGALPASVDIYREYHALVVEHAKRHCAARPRCVACPLADRCPSVEREPAQKIGNK